jgi:hypothetical protein
MADLDGVSFVRRGGHLVPADVRADEMVGMIKEGQEVLVTIRKARSPEHHRWFFAMLRKVIENTEEWNSEEELLTALKFAAGHVDRCSLLDGTVVEMPRSINFGSMDEFQFRRWKDRAVYLLSQYIGVDPTEFMKEVDATQRRVR